MVEQGARRRPGFRRADHLRELARTGGAPPQLAAHRVELTASTEVAATVARRRRIGEPGATVLDRAEPRVSVAAYEDPDDGAVSRRECVDVGAVPGGVRLAEPSDHVLCQRVLHAGWHR